MPTRRRPVIAAASSFAGLLLSSCVDGTGRDATYGLAVVADLSSLDGETLVADDIVDGPDLVSGTQVTMSFTGDTVIADAGCKRLSGLAAIDGNELVLGHLTSTRQACVAALEDQDQWLISFLTSRPTFERIDDDLYLSHDDTVIHLVPEED